MAQLAGRKIVVSASTDGSTWHPIGEQNSVDLNIQGAALDVTKFGDNDVENVLGLRNVAWSLSGFYDPTDTTGQQVILSSLLNGTALYLQAALNPGGGSGLVGFFQQVVCTGYNPKGAVAAVETIDTSFVSTGAITAY